MKDEAFLRNLREKIDHHTRHNVHEVRQTEATDPDDLVAVLLSAMEQVRKAVEERGGKVVGVVAVTPTKFAVSYDVEGVPMVAYCDIRRHDG